MTSLERQELMTAEACGELELVARFDGPMPTGVTVSHRLRRRQQRAKPLVG